MYAFGTYIDHRLCIGEVQAFIPNKRTNSTIVLSLQSTRQCGKYRKETGKRILWEFVKKLDAHVNEAFSGVGRPIRKRAIWLWRQDGSSGIPSLYGGVQKSSDAQETIPT